MLNRYTTILALSILLLTPLFCSASEVGNAVVTVADGVHQTKPASAFNTINKEVLIVWTEGKGGCANNIVLMGQFMDYQTGGKNGNPFQVFEATSSCESSIIEIPEIVFDDVNNQYFVVVKTIQGGSKKVVGFLVNENGVKSSTTVEFASSTFGDPYNKLIAAFDPYDQKFLVGYHVQTGTSDMALHLQKINPSNGQKDGAEVVFDKNTSGIPGTKGPKGSIVVFNSINNNYLLLFHAENATSSEVWGAMLNPTTLEASGGFFQVSPNGTTNNQYKNPSAAYNESASEFLVVYEDVDLVATDYEQAAAIYGQKIDASDGTKKGTGNTLVSKIPLGGCGSCIEQAKLPAASFSPIKGEYLVSFYGTPTSSGLEKYNIYGSRINTTTMAIINGTSFMIASEKGTTVNTNNALQTFAIQYFEDTDKFLFAWLDETNSTIESQLRKYQNHAPTGLVMSANSVNESAELNTLVAELTTEDLDEDDQFTYSLVSGEGSTDNGTFNITGNELRINQLLDFEIQEELSIRVRSTDVFGETIEKSFLITVNDVNETPININLSNDAVNEYMPIGTFVAKLSTFDPDNNNTHSYELTSGSDSFYISNDSLFTNVVLVYSQQTHLEISITSTDQGGLFFEKNFIISIIEFPDFEAPQIVSQNFSEFYALTNSSEKVSIEAIDDTGIKVVNFYCKAISSDQWRISSVQPQGNIFEASIQKTELDKTGVQYFFEVSDIKNYSYSDTVTMRIQFDEGDITLDGLDFGGKAENYQIIAIPYYLENASIKSNFEDDLGIQKADSWRILHYENGACCQEYPGTIQNFERGKGYWFNQKQSNTIDLGEGQVLFDSLSEHVEITLNAGWNQIGNPYPFDIDWTEVISYAENESLFQTGVVSNSLYVFDQGNFSKSTNLPAFRGAFISAESAASLKIPFYAMADGNGRTAGSTLENPLSDSNWEVELNLVSGDNTYKMGGIGMNQEASISKDKFDELMVPRFGNYVDYHIKHDEYFYPFFAKDIVPTNDQYSWEFTVASNLAHSSSLSWDNSYFGRSEKQLVLIDLASGFVIDMYQQDAYEFNLGNEKKFRIAFGRREFVNEELSKLDPVADLAYPNPFTDQVNIPLRLPVMDLPMEVEFMVFNNLGEKIYTQQQTFHQNNSMIQWNGLDNNSKHINTGIYFYKVVITNTGKYFTGKVVKH